eukprot:4871524-Amphidinium_carterae.1
MLGVQIQLNVWRGRCLCLRVSNTEERRTELTETLEKVLSTVLSEGVLDAHEAARLRGRLKI